MRPIGSPRQLQQRRDQALKLLKRGRRCSEVAQRVGITPRSVRRWHQETRIARSTARSHRSPGCPCRLVPRQLKHLARVLARGPVAYGYSGDCWSLQRVQGLIRNLFGIGYQASSVWYLLGRMKWSCQKPQRVGFQHDEAAIAYWKRYRWPWIKKLANAGRNPCFSR
jgi:transposase